MRLYALPVPGAKIIHDRPPGAVAPGAVALTCVGLAVVVTGTFLPWLRSGTVERSSYATDGALHRLLGDGGGVGLALALWPFVSLACAAAAALLIVGGVRSGAALAALAGLVAGALGIAVLTVDRAFAVQPSALGPSVTAAGAALTLLFASSLLITRRSVDHTE